MNRSDPMSLSTTVGSTEFNPTGTSDGFFLTDDSAGFGQAPIRAVVDDRPQTDGGIVHPARKGPRRLTIVAQYILNSGSIDDRDAAIAALIEQLDSILDGDGGIWTVHTSDGDLSLNPVRVEIPLVPTGGPQLKQVAFGLVAANPDWS